MHSLRFKITAITVAAILTSILFVFITSYSTVQTQSDQSSVETMDLLGDDTAKSLENYTENIELSIDTIANVASGTLDSVALVKGGVAGSAARQANRTPEQTAQLDAYLDGYFNNIQRISATVASHGHGVVAYYYCINPEISSAEHGFFYSNVGKTGFVEQPPLNARELDPNDIEHTTWYFTSIERGRPSWIGPYTAHFLNEMTICSYIVPIYKAGTMIGVLGMDIQVDVLIDQVKSLKVYDTGFACLLDDQNRVVYHPTLPFGTVPNISVGTDVFHKKNSRGELIRYTADGENRQMSFTTLSNGMKLVIVAPTDEVNASPMHLVKTIVPITLLIIVVFVALSLLLMRVITNPLQRLTAASQRLADADYDVELDYEGQDEVGSLTTAFQRMRDQLKDNIDDLNRRLVTDDLTGLANQKHFFDLAEAERKRLIDEGKSPVMLYFNLVGLKHFNRQYGFEEGDRLLLEIAAVLTRRYGENNVGRFGQDHFAVATDGDYLEERLEYTFRECKAANGGRTVPISVGIYYDSLDPVDPSIACDRAKFACDQRRGSYISGYQYFNESMLEEVEIARHVIEHLDQAIEEGWVTVYYQPIVRATNNKVCDEEALSRWIDPKLGFLPPDRFIPALESAGLIYKIDLFVLEEILRKMKSMQEKGLTVVPHSVNLSRSDFESCDIVDEIRKRVDASGFERSMISVEITESIIGQSFGFMKRQVKRFQDLGFPVWMDDFGSGYSSLDVLQSIQFDLIKFDMSFMRKLHEGENGKIILTQMMRMAHAMGVDTVCEGVETNEQRQFLLEIGCSKLQGFYFNKPIPYAQLLERYEKGIQIGFENPQESEYYEAIGRLNLHDLSSVASGDENSFRDFFDSLPMAVIEVKGAETKLVRTNQSFRDFSKRYFNYNVSDQSPNQGIAIFERNNPLAKALRECSENGNRIFFDDETPDGHVVRSIVRRIKTNPVTGTTAVAVAALSITEPDEGATYANIARALARDYYNIYYVDLDTEHFIEYRSPVGGEELVKERHGENFFEETVEETRKRMYGEDRDAFLASFTKENIIRDLDERGVYTATYRLVDTGSPMYVSMKVTRMESGANRVIMGVSIRDLLDNTSLPE